MPRRYTPRPPHRRFERGGELQDDVLGRGPGSELNADRQTGECMTSGSEIAGMPRMLCGNVN
jgi:hypothetical protein